MPSNKRLRCSKSLNCDLVASILFNIDLLCVILLNLSVYDIIKIILVNNFIYDFLKTNDKSFVTIKKCITHDFGNILASKYFKFNCKKSYDLIQSIYTHNN